MVLAMAVALRIHSLQQAPCAPDACLTLDTLLARSAFILMLLTLLTQRHDCGVMEFQHSQLLLPHLSCAASLQAEHSVNACCPHTMWVCLSGPPEQSPQQRSDYESLVP